MAKVEIKISGNHFKISNFCDIEKDRDILNLGKSIINLANLDGSTKIAIKPTEFIELAGQAVNLIDIQGCWQSWLNKNFGDKLLICDEFLNNKKSNYQDKIRVTIVKNSNKNTIGINFGGYYTRLSHLSPHNTVSLGPEIINYKVNESIFHGIDIEKFCNLIIAWIKKIDKPYDSIGIAWAAPRGKNGEICPYSFFFKACPEIAEYLESETLRSMLEEKLCCDISFWNDGESTAVSEYFFDKNTNSLIAFKFGSSIACGYVFNNDLYLLPLEIGKCVFNIEFERSNKNTIHPVTKIPGTLRELSGIRSTLIRYFNDEMATNRFDEFKKKTLKYDYNAIIEMNQMVRNIIEAIKFLNDVIGEFSLFISGKNLEGKFGTFLYNLIKKEISKQSELCDNVKIFLSNIPLSYSAAIGASILAR